jgi:hypothetical protein
MHHVIGLLGPFPAWAHHVHLTAWDKELSGYIASALVLTSFCMRSMRWLRTAAIGSNVSFIFFATVSDIRPVLVLHSILLPINVTRLLQLRRARVEAQRLLAGTKVSDAHADLARPRFLSQHATADPASALPLAEQEQYRVVGLLVAHVPSEAATTSGLVAAAATAAAPMLLGEIDRFLAAVSANRPSPRELAWVAALHSRNEELRHLQETLAGVASQLPQAAKADATEIAGLIAEGLGTLLLHAEDAARPAPAGDVELLMQTTGDRSALVTRIRRKAIEDSANHDPAHLQFVYGLTSLYERAVWLLHRYAILLAHRQDADQAARD